jgi:hypothetical protein
LLYNVIPKNGITLYNKKRLFHSPFYCIINIPKQKRGVQMSKIYTVAILGVGGRGGKAGGSLVKIRKE